MFKYFLQIPKFFELFKEGKEVANAETWKNRSIAINAILTFLGTALALAKTLGFPVELDHDTTQNLAAGIVAIVTAFNAVMHTITSARVGLPSNSGNSSPEGQTADGNKPAEG
jgi:hypothetical protein